MKDSYFSGIIRRCGQYYYNTDYDTYLSIKDRVEEAYSLFYGNYFTECNIDLVSDNKDNWDDGLEYKHKVYVFKTLQIPKLTLRCNIDAYDYIVKSVHGGGNLMLKITLTIIYLLIHLVQKLLMELILIIKRMETC